MKWPLKSVYGLPVSAADGVVGPLVDLYVHDALWLVRGIAVNAYASARRVVLPVSRVEQSGLHPAGIRVRLRLEEIAALPRVADLSVRSARALASYGTMALDGPAGRVEDLVVDDAGWWIAELLLDTRNLFPGSERVVPSRAVSAIDSLHRELHLRLTRSQIRRLPAPRRPVWAASAYPPSAKPG